MTEDDDYDAYAPVPVGPLSAEVDEALAPPPPRGVPWQVAAVGALALLVIGVGAGRWSAPVQVARTAPGPAATVTTVATVTGDVPPATVTAYATPTGGYTASPVTVTATPIATPIATVTATATDRIVIPGPIRTITRPGPALVVRVTATRTVTRR